MKNHGLQIVVIDRGWVFVGTISEDEKFVYIDNGACISTWGTTKGLGQLAMSGPLPKTVLEPVTRIRVSEKARLFMLECVPSAWKNKLTNL